MDRICCHFQVLSCVDEFEFQLSKHGSLKKLNTVIGPEERPQHSFAWIGIACGFPVAVYMDQFIKLFIKF
ncbi:hypothetical protein MTR_3g014450 [Medicago truncatula]|uniref:Uncharacterized protein n=1 Tax=Medicago truncatula TaxID=3880 RepID=G7J0I9_MEDTR|nr:hypothetical protein MTR_3g014450 [Medicago truncatula]